MNSRPVGRPRLYDARWRELSRAYLKVHPHCAYCLKRKQRLPSSIVDHILPHRGNQFLFWDKRNWQALCRTCHNGAKHTEENRGTTIGCDEAGNPLDPRRNWGG